MPDQGIADAPIEAVDLRRTYRAHTGWLHRRYTDIEAVRGVSFSVAPGELFGLLGPNGAGKTTTIKMLNTLLLPTSGSARVLGYDVRSEPMAVRRRIGYVFGGDKGLYDRLSAEDNLRYFAELYCVEPRDQRARIGELLELVGLAGREKERVEGYSRGMRQRLHIARGLLHRPPVLFLDEPSIGLDPVAARELRRMVADLKYQGVTIVLTTHYMAEADELCDRIAVIDRGVIQALGTPRELKDRVDTGAVLEVEVVGASPRHLSALSVLPGARDVRAADRDDRKTITIHAVKGADLYAAVMSELDGLSVTRFTSREPTLEDAYLGILTDASEQGQSVAV